MVKSCELSENLYKIDIRLKTLEGNIANMNKR